MANVTRGMIIPIDGGGSVVRFQWNPKEVQSAVQAEWAVIKTAGSEQPFLQFCNGEAPTLQFDLEYSRSDNNDGFVLAQVQAIQRLTKPLVKGASMSRPPLVKFVMGSLPRPTCIVKQANAVFSGLFHPTSLLPYEAKVSVILWEYR